MRLNDKMINKVVIPAAGLGTRFRPATQFIPKELIPVLNVPALTHTANEAIQSGIREIIIINSKTKPLLREWISRFNTEHQSEGVSAIELTQEFPLGLGHAILQAKQAVGMEAFGIMLPDDIIFSKPPALKRMIELHCQLRGSILCVKENPINLIKNYGVIEPHGNKVEGIIEKPDPHDAPSQFCALGRYILEPEIFNYLEKAKPSVNNEIQLTDSLNSMMGDQDFFHYIVEGHHFDIGTPTGLISASIFASQNPNLIIG